MTILIKRSPSNLLSRFRQCRLRATQLAMFRAPTPFCDASWQSSPVVDRSCHTRRQIAVQDATEENYTDVALSVVASESCKVSLPPISASRAQNRNSTKVMFSPSQQMRTLLLQSWNIYP